MIKKIITKIRHELKFNNTKYYKRVSDKILKTLYKKRLRKRMEELLPLVLNLLLSPTKEIFTNRLLHYIVFVFGKGISRYIIMKMGRWVKRK